MSAQQEPSTRNIDLAALQGDDRELFAAAQEFEAFFLNMLFREMRNTVNREDGLFPVSRGEQIFQEMLDEERAAAASRNGGIGLAEMIFRQMSRSSNTVTASMLVNGGINSVYGDINSVAAEQNPYGAAIDESDE